MSLSLAPHCLLRPLVLGAILIGIVPGAVPETLPSGARASSPASSGPPAQAGVPASGGPPPPEPRVPRKQREALLKSNLEKMRRDADELADLAKSLREDLTKTNQNVLSLEIVQRAEKIEKLAKKIKETARGF